AVAPENPGEPTGGDDHRLGGDCYCVASGAVERDRTHRLAIDGDDVGDIQIADPADRGDIPDPAAQRRGDGRAGLEKIDITAARPRVAGRGDLGDPPVV